MRRRSYSGRYWSAHSAQSAHKRVRRGVYDLAACAARAAGTLVDSWEHVTCPLCLRRRGTEAARG